MEHPDDEILTQFALDDPLALDAATLVHISDCDQCTDEIQAIQRVVDAALAAGGRPDLRTLTPPPAEVWDRVLVGVGAPVGSAAQEAVAPTAAAMPAPIELSAAAALDELSDDDASWLFDHHGELEPAAPRAADTGQPTDRRTLWQVAVAAAVGLVLGAGGAWVVADRGGSSSDTTATGVVSRSALTGLDGHTTSGEIALRTRAGKSPQITVKIDSLDKGPGFLEAWLLDADTGGMVALGVLDGPEGTFNVPPSLNLSRYSQVDVSREPFDGDPAHSSTSLARGPVPGA